MTQLISSIKVNLRFYGRLNSFLPYEKRRTFYCLVKGHPAVKDTIEASGVPHPEVDAIFVNGRSVDFSYHLQDRDRIRVYPDVPNIPLKKIKRLKTPIPGKPQFLLDAHLGKLARLLRLVGFDTLYQHDYSDEQIMRIALKERRIILSRDVGLLKNKIIPYGSFVYSTEPRTQIREILKRFRLAHEIQPFHLCLECNGRIKKVSKEKILSQLPPRTQKYYRNFYQCLWCQKIYWQGSHYHNLRRVIAKVC